MNARARVGVAALVALSPALAWAQPCAPAAVASGPLALGPGPADFGEVAEPCAANQAVARLRGILLVDTPDFYGAISAGVTLGGRYRIRERWWVSGALDMPTWRYTVNAVVASTALDAGPATVAVHRALVTRESFAVAAHVRALVPVDTARRFGLRTGAELGASAIYRPGVRWFADGGLTAPTALVVLGGRTHVSVVPAALAEMGFALRSWLALSLGAALRTEVHPSPALLALAARPALRVRTGGGWRFALGADVRLVGVDRTAAAVSLFVGRGD